MIIKYKDLEETLFKILVKKGVTEVQAELTARIITDNTCDGINSHGVNRFSKIIEYIDKGYIDKNAKPEIESSFGAIEIINGHYGLGINSAYFAMDRAISLAKKNGIGCVSLKLNSHWMRGATYGIQATHAGMIGLCFTNTLPNMPVWGAVDSRIGNNPLVIAIPKKDNPIVLDMAMSQFSYGKIETTALNGEELPLVGGYDNHGELTTDPKEILESGRILPTGFWKGSGLSMVLDLFATIVAGGLSTKEIGDKPVEMGVSQVFICINPEIVQSREEIERQVESVVTYIKQSEPISSDQTIRYPGEGSFNRRKKQLKEGIYVDDSVWNGILEML